MHHQFRKKPLRGKGEKVKLKATNDISYAHLHMCMVNPICTPCSYIVHRATATIHSYGNTGCGVFKWGFKIRKNFA